MAYAVSKSVINSYRKFDVVELSSYASSQLSARPIYASPRAPANGENGELKGKRRRGVVLTRQGWQKLDQAGVLCDRFGNRYTHEQLGERSLLDNRTVSRILSCETKVDKRTLKIFFETFNLRLDINDYAAPESKGSLANTLTNLGIPEQNALKYDNELKMGKFLVIVASTDEELQRVQRILQNAGQAVSEPVAV